MAEILKLEEAVRRFVPNGASVAMEGFTHLIPHAAGHEVIRQGITGLTLYRMTPDIIYDQLIGMGCADKLVFSWGGNPGVGSLHRLRDSVENGWPGKLDIVEHAHAAMANAYEAGAAGLPMAVFRGYIGTDHEKVNPQIKRIDCPFSGETLACIPSIQPDVAIIHAQKADRKGNVLIWGILGVQKEAVLAAKHAIVTVEEIVDDLEADMNATVLPRWTISAICEVPRGAHPSYAHGYYKRHNSFYKAWDKVARDRDTFREWIDKYVMSVPDFAGTWAKLEADGYV